MVRIKVMRMSSLIYFVVITVLAVAVCFLSWRLLSGNPVRFHSAAEQEEQSPPAESGEDKGNSIYKAMLNAGFSALAAGDRGSDNFFSTLWYRISRGGIRDPRTVLNYSMPYLGKESDLPDNTFHTPDTPDNAVEVSSALPDGNADKSSKPVSADSVDSEEGGSSDVSEEARIIIDQIKVDPQPLVLPGQGPKIMIYHSHTRESFQQDPSDPYKEASSEAFRTNDLSHSVVKVGEALAQRLTERGIAVLHDTTNHEAAGYNSSYAQSLKTLKAQKAAHSSLQMFIDLHRNGYNTKSKAKADQEVVTINGERVAKVMVVIGTGEGTVGGFREKPKWKENASLAIKLTNKVNELYPGLAKEVLYKRGRYNQHISTNSILIEVGSNLTTLAEADRSSKYLAEAISQIIE